MRGMVEGLGRRLVNGVEEFGYGSALLVESLYWLLLGPSLKQPVRLSAVATEMMRVGVNAIPVVLILSFANGVMMALQGIYTLRDFGAESQVIPGLALSISREFGALIVGIVVAGRSGSAIAARIGAMQMSQEIDALRVLGVNPVRFLVAPIMLAMMVMVPALTVLANSMALLGGGLLCSLQLHMSLSAFWNLALSSLEVSDIVQGMSKSLVFAVLIALVACINGFSASGGAEGLGMRTTRSVVLCIAAIVIADMVFTFFLSR
ncbi:ABC transporter permease [Thiohalobacter sp. IOR34]|uniref:MlaE family ABC transporter permease n=1 Tax=Thiohalobacter sp. IOR34 TaxID=3057176 RepID=UPI0025B068F9|nr:ABC transporter permease [Thiohalobacter sp. IOR34]WJW74627.1 ABC transporter permease [Thiohalobacter sp. IOR34]